MEGYAIRPLGDDDRDWVSRFVAERWGAETIVSRGRIHRPRNLPGFVAVEGDERVGLLSYHVAGGECEIVSLDSLRPASGVGTALIAAAERAARGADCRRLWLITTNDNLPTLRFYQRRGFPLVAIHRNAVEEARKLKPAIPLIGLDGIPIRDEVELELPLDDRA